MSASVQWQGLDELKRQLRSMPEHLADAAGAIVESTGRRAASDVRGDYPEGPTGKLRRGVRVSVLTSRFGMEATLRSSAPHAYIFEKGTAVRRNRRGANRGQMPAADVSRRMIPKVVKHRKAMYQALKAMLVNNGFQVSDE